MSDFNLGDIVALNSHPYNNNLTSIVISGEPQFVSPLMVIIELLNDTKEQYDEKTGEEISKRGNAQCKCIWYSNKSQQFEESWISSKLLKHIDNNLTPIINLNEQEKKDMYGRLVVFKTSRLEGNKKKSSLSIENSSLNISKEKNITNPLLSYLCPVMQIIQIIEAKIDSKDSVFDSKTGKLKRFTSKWLVKCKWYNPNDKFSEKLLPIECLDFIAIIDPILLEDIQEKIETLGFYIYNKSIIQPQRIYSLNGIYFIKAYDYIINKIIDIELINNKLFTDTETVFNNEVPTFDFESGDVLPDNYFDLQYSEAIRRANSAKRYLRIRYKNRIDEISMRTLKDCAIIVIEEGKKQVSYLRGYCMTRKALRNFKIDRIQKLQELNITY